MSVGSVIISTRMLNASTHVDLRVSHPMESGLRVDGANTAIPSWYLTHMEVFHNDKRVAQLELGPLVSRNPAISLVLNGGAAKDIVKVTWVDSRGEGGEQLAEIT